ncbi:MAG: ABC-type transport auxiliary lipoprotein family protein [Rhizomicrobium sp.]|jgi:cholesterol transport system auxiliary component
MTKYSAYLPLSRRGLLVGTASLLVLSGCSGIIGPSSPPPQIYVLQPEFRALGNSPEVTWQLAIGAPGASESLDTARIALHRGETLDYFADARWTDATPILIQEKLVEAFEKSTRIRAVAATSDAVRADYVVESTIRDFQANYETQDGTPTIVADIVVRIVRAERNDVVATHDFHHEVRAARNDVPSVVAAFDQAAGAVFEEIVDWTLHSAVAEKSMPDTPAASTPTNRKHKIAS